MPRVSATIRSRTCSSRPPGIPDASSARASSSPSPSTTSSGSPPSSCTSHGWRTANTIATGSASRRRATKDSAWADSRSSHCTSSTTHTQRPLLGGVGQQVERSETEQVAIRSRSLGQPERQPQRLLLRGREVIYPLEHPPPYELLQPRQRQLHLRLDATRPRDPASRRALHEVVQQYGLPHTCLSANDQHRASPRPDLFDDSVERNPFCSAAPQAWRALGAGHSAAHRQSPTLSLKTGQRDRDHEVALLAKLR